MADMLLIHGEASKEEIGFASAEEKAKTWRGKPKAS